MWSFAHGHPGANLKHASFSIVVFVIRTFVMVHYKKCNRQAGSGDFVMRIASIALYFLLEKLSRASPCIGARKPANALLFVGPPYHTPGVTAINEQELGIVDISILHLPFYIPSNCSSINRSSEQVHGTRRVATLKHAHRPTSQLFTQSPT